MLGKKTSWIKKLKIIPMRTYYLDEDLCAQVIPLSAFLFSFFPRDLWLGRIRFLPATQQQGKRRFLDFSAAGSTSDFTAFCRAPDQSGRLST